MFVFIFIILQRNEKQKMLLTKMRRVKITSLTALLIPSLSLCIRDSLLTHAVNSHPTNFNLCTCVLVYVIKTDQICPKKKKCVVIYKCKQTVCLWVRLIQNISTRGRAMVAARLTDHHMPINYDVLLIQSVQQLVTVASHLFLFTII